MSIERIFNFIEWKREIEISLEICYRMYFELILIYDYLWQIEYILIEGSRFHFLQFYLHFILFKMDKRHFMQFRLQYMYKKIPHYYYIKRLYCKEYGSALML